MSAAAVTTPRERHGLARERRALPRRSAVRLFDPGRPTLDDRISALWDCPVCGSELLAGRECGGCGSELS
jgi:hypothetical protein